MATLEDRAALALVAKVRRGGLPALAAERRRRAATTGADPPPPLTKVRAKLLERYPHTGPIFV